MSTSRSRLAVLGVLLLAGGGALVFAALTRPWGHFAGMPMTPAELSRLIPEDRAALTVWWWDATNNCCGPLPVLWPALALIAAVPSAVASMRGRTADFRWGTGSMVFAVYGAITVVVAMSAFVERSHFSDSGWVYAADWGTLALSGAGYALLFVGAWMVRGLTIGDERRGASA
jgi:hypothetical protein